MSESAEVADDFKADLKDLTSNDRYAISNFTVIAKESVQHADAISNVILDHIIETNRNHKLAAIYVLDSIVKNIGNPYTLFISPRLYTAFMEAYCVVDPATRRKLDETLKTWKSSAPGSTDPRPVFPPDVTKRIENALIQWKTKTFQQEQEQQRAQHALLGRLGQGATQWRNTPTPPQMDPRYPAPVSSGYVQFPQQPYQPPQHDRPPSQNQFHQPIHSHSGNFNHSPDVNSLHQDTEQLIEQTKADWARNPFDEGMQTRLKALLDLQSLLKSQQLPPEQLQAVRSQLSMLQVSPRPQSRNSYHPHPQSHPASHAEAPTYSTPTPLQGYQPPPAPSAPPFSLPHSQPPAIRSPQISTQQLPSADFLTSLLSQAGQNRTPQSQQQAAAHPLAQASNPASAGPENPLIAQLRASGLLNSATPVSNSLNTTPLLNIAAQPPPPNAAAHGLLSMDLSQLLRNVRPDPTNDIQLTSASLKKPRPHLISRLYEAQPNQCSTCGRRFPANEEGKTKKARHLDWHFKTNQRLVEAAQRGQSRSWYVDETEWIKYRDNGEGNEESVTNGLDPATAAAEAAARNDPKNKFIPVPSDNALRNAPCPICQEQFEQSWNEESQDFVFIDAVRVGGRIYHASCYADYRKHDDGNTPARNSTPDSVLGKRKAEANSTGPSPAKIRREGDG